MVSFTTEDLKKINDKWNYYNPNKETIDEFIRNLEDII